MTSFHLSEFGFPEHKIRENGTITNEKGYELSVNKKLGSVILWDPTTKKGTNMSRDYLIRFYFESPWCEKSICEMSATEHYQMFRLPHYGRRKSLV